jgi:hypothetical protein
MVTGQEPSIADQAVWGRRLRERKDAWCRSNSGRSSALLRANGSAWRARRSACTAQTKSASNEEVCLRPTPHLSGLDPQGGWARRGIAAR